MVIEELVGITVVEIFFAGIGMEVPGSILLADIMHISYTMLPILTTVVPLKR